MRLSLFACCMVAAGLAAPLAVAAQEAPPAFGERVEVEVVNVDVVVTDASGKRGHEPHPGGLPPGGRRQAVPIDYFAPPGAQPLRPAAERRTSPRSRRSICRARISSSSSIRARSSGGRASRSSRRSAAFVLPRTGGNERIMIAAFVENLRILSPPTADRKRIEEAFAELEKLRGRGSLVVAERSLLEREVRENARPRAQIEITTPDTGEVGEPNRRRGSARQDQADTANLRRRSRASASSRSIVRRGPSRRCASGSGRWRRSRAASRSFSPRPAIPRSRTPS